MYCPLVGKRLHRVTAYCVNAQRTWPRVIKHGALSELWCSPPKVLSSKFYSSNGLLAIMMQIEFNVLTAWSYDSPANIKALCQNACG